MKLRAPSRIEMESFYNKMELNIFPLKMRLSDLEWAHFKKIKMNFRFEELILTFSENLLHCYYDVGLRSKLWHHTGVELG